MGEFDFNKFLPALRVATGRVVAGLIILLLFLAGAKIIELLVCRLRTRVPHNESLLRFLAKILKGAIILFGIATALGTMGINVSALVAGLGLTGFALGFAFRDVLSNVLAGVLLLLFRPFDIGDEIAVSGFQGHVISIDMRYTVLQQPEKIVLIPNSNLFTNPIVVMAKTEPPPVVGGF